MPAEKTARPPKYRRFKPKDLGVVRLNGKNFYLGRFDSPESWQKYHQLIAEWHSNGRSTHPPVVRDSKTGFIGINCVVEAFLDFAKSYYAKNDAEGKELNCINRGRTASQGDAVVRGKKYKSILSPWVSCLGNSASARTTICTFPSGATGICSTNRSYLTNSTAAPRYNRLHEVQPPEPEVSAAKWIETLVLGCT